MQFLLSDLRLPSDQKRSRTSCAGADHHAGRGAGVRHRERHARRRYVQEVLRARSLPSAPAADRGGLGHPDHHRRRHLRRRRRPVPHGKLPQRGFIRQEQVALPDFLANRFGMAYEQSRRIESIS
jgi:hypothetical protein